MDAVAGACCFALGTVFGCAVALWSFKREALRFEPAPTKDLSQTVAVRGEAAVKREVPDAYSGTVPVAASSDPDYETDTDLYPRY